MPESFFMKECPFEFHYKGQTYKAILSLVNGGPSATWHLMINKGYWGQLFHAKDHGWQFFSNHDPGLSQYAEFFGHIVTSWEDSPGE